MTRLASTASTRRAGRPSWCMRPRPSAARPGLACATERGGTPAQAISYRQSPACCDPPPPGGRGGQVTRRGHVDDGCDLFVMLSGRLRESRESRGACSVFLRDEGTVCSGAERACERRSRCNGASHAACSVRSGPVPCVCVLCVLRCLSFCSCACCWLRVHSRGVTRVLCKMCSAVGPGHDGMCQSKLSFWQVSCFPTALSHPAELRERRPTKQSRCGPLRLLASTRRVRLLVSTRLDSSPSLRCASYPCPRTEPLLLRPRGRRGRCCRRGQPPRCRPQHGLRAPPSTRAPRSLSSTG